MRFVRLALRSVVRVIKKRGLHLGDGRMGRGDHAVPFRHVPRFRDRDPSNWPCKSCDEMDLSAPVTSGDL